MSEIIDLILKLSQEIKWLKVYISQLQKSQLEHFKEAWIDGQEVMLSLNISKRTLQTLRDNGTLPYSRINGKFYYKVSDLETLLESNYSPFNNRSYGNK